MTDSSAMPEPTDISSDAWDAFVARSPQGSLFATRWWLDAVAGAGKWRTHAVCADNGEIIAGWPTVVRGSRWGDVHVIAPLTPYLGPLYAPDDNLHRRRSNEIRALEAVLDTMRPFAHAEARCHPAFDYWTPLSWNGFTQTTHYSWRIAPGNDVNTIFANLRKNIRGDVRKAQKQGLEVGEGTLDDFLAVQRKTFERQGAESSMPSLNLVRRIDAAAAARDARTILLARDADGQVHSGGYFVHDARYTYYLLGGSDTSLRASGAASLVVWNAIERAVGAGRGFDFEGSMLRPVERFVRAFGGDPAPYTVVHGTPSRGYRAERSLKRAVRQALRDMRRRIR